MYRSMHGFISKHRSGKITPILCPNCGYSSLGNPENNLLEIFPDIVHWWDYVKNAPYRPEQFTKGSQFKAHLTCPDCGIELYHGLNSVFFYQEDDSVSIKHIGKCRKLRAQASENNLLKRYPDVADYWDYEKNGKDKPEDFTLFSSKKAYFKCPNCGAESYRRICDAFILKEDGQPVLFSCPYCNGIKALPGYNSLQVKHPDLMKEWAEIENLLIGVSPDHILDRSEEIVWWKCMNPDCQRMYMMSVNDRVLKAKRQHTPCPYCNGRRQRLPHFV